MAENALGFDVIKQHAGPVQAERKVKVKVPGKQFPALTPSEQKEDFWGTAVEAADRLSQISPASESVGRRPYGSGDSFYLRIRRARQLS